MSAKEHEQSAVGWRSNFRVRYDQVALAQRPFERFGRERIAFGSRRSSRNINLATNNHGLSAACVAIQDGRRGASSGWRSRLRRYKGGVLLEPCPDFHVFCEGGKDWLAFGSDAGRHDHAVRFHS